MAAKHFQDNWNPEDEDFGAMIEQSLEKSKSQILIDTPDIRPNRQIISFAKERPEDTKQMFVDLFDDSKDYTKRAMAFEEEAKGKF